VIWIFARDENGKPETVKVKGFVPYFYIRQGESYKATGEKGITLTNIKAKTIYGKSVVRVEVRKPGDVSKMRKKFLETWESDILFPIRFMIDKDLFSTFTYDGSNITPVEADPTPPRVFFIDIEVATPKEDWSGAFEARHEIICISIYDSYTKVLTTMIYHPEPEKITKRDNLEVFTNETDLLEAFTAKVNLFKPDIITGWNVVDFDIPYIITRMRRLKLDPNALSPLSFTRIEQSEGFLKSGRVKLKGLSVVDLLSAYRKFFAKAFPSYALQAIAQKDLGESKIDISNFYDTWVNDPDEIIKRNALDVDFLQRIDSKWGLLDHYTKLKNMIGATYDDVLSSKRLIDIKILRKAKERGIVLPKSNKVEEVEESYVGAYVMLPKTGIHSNVIVLDFKSLYPSIFTSFNISPDTLTSDPSNSYKVGRWFFKKTPVGILPESVTELQNLRSATKEEMKKYAVGTPEYEALNSKQRTIKFLINAFYGVFGYPKFRLYNKEVAEAVTLRGQKYVRKTADMLESWGYDVLYGDTDSVFVRIDGDLNNALMQGEMLANRITSELRTSFSGAEIVIEFEKVYSKILFGKVKKRYAGIKVWDGGQPTNKLDVTGFEVKRSDSSLLSIDIQKKVMNILLSEDDPEQSLKSLLRGLKSSFEDVPLTMMAMPKGVKKSLDSYGGVNAKGGKIGIPAVVRAAMYSNKHFGTSFGAGSKPKMIYIRDVPDGYEKTDVIAFDDDTVIPLGFIPDYEKMWNTIVKRKVQPLVEIIGLDFDELVDTHRQSRLDEFQEAK